MVAAGQHYADLFMVNEHVSDFRKVPWCVIIVEDQETRSFQRYQGVLEGYQVPFEIRGRRGDLCFRKYGVHCLASTYLGARVYP